MRFLALAAGLLALVAPIVSQSQTLNVTLPPAVNCGSESSPNELYGYWADNVTGVLNGTIYILPIPLATARAYIPKQWNILTQNYERIFPYLTKDTYPAILQLQHDHDIRYGMNIRISDFMRASIEFPFIDLLGDNSTSFRWVGKQFVSADKPIAIAGIAEYGTIPIPADFNPSCNAYQGPHDGKANFKANESKELGDAFVDADISAFNWTNSIPSSQTFGMANVQVVTFMRDVTNQPVFGNGSLCNTQLYPKYHDEGTPYVKDFVTGKVSARCAIAGGPGEILEWANAIGYRQPKQFVEINGQDCKALKGYNADVADRILLGLPNPFHNPGTPLV